MYEEVSWNILQLIVILRVLVLQLYNPSFVARSSLGRNEVVWSWGHDMVTSTKHLQRNQSWKPRVRNKKNSNPFPSGESDRSTQAKAPSTFPKVLQGFHPKDSGEVTKNLRILFRETRAIRLHMYLLYSLYVVYFLYFLYFLWEKTLTRSREKGLAALGKHQEKRW